MRFRCDVRGEKDETPPIQAGFHAQLGSALGASRTPDLQIRNLVLYPLSYERRGRGGASTPPIIAATSAGVQRTRSNNNAEVGQVGGFRGATRAPACSLRPGPCKVILGALALPRLAAITGNHATHPCCNGETCGDSHLLMGVCGDALW